MKNCLNKALILFVLSAIASTSFAVVQDNKAWIRLGNDAKQLKINKLGTYVAYIENDGPVSTHPQTNVTSEIKRPGLYILNLENQNIYQVTNKQVDAAFFWSPEGHRLFYREMNSDGKTVTSKINAYDTALHKSVEINKADGATGYLTYDPRDMDMSILGEKTISKNSLKFPGKAPAKQVTDKDSWLVTPKGVLRVSSDRKKIRMLIDDKSGVSSFDIFKDGEKIAWATKKGNIYTADLNSETDNAEYLDRGLDPSWHPNKQILIYAGARLLGNVAVSYDLKLTNLRSNKSFLTETSYSDERWPLWHPNGKDIIYTKDKTTDLYKLSL